VPKTTSEQDHPVAEEPDGTRYYRRWVAAAWTQTVAFAGYGLRGWLVAVVGPSVGLLVLSAVLGGSNQVGEALIELRWLGYGAIGSVAIFALLFIWNLIRSPRDLEGIRDDEWRVATSALRTELAQSEEARRSLEATELDVELEHQGPALRAIDFGETARDALARFEVGRYLGPFQSAVTKARQQPPYLSVGVLNEQRTQDEFLAEVEAYGYALKSRWQDVARHLAIEGHVTSIEPVLRNRSGRAFQGLELQLKLPEGATAGWGVNEADPPVEPPEPWGTNTLFSGLRAIALARATEPGVIESVDGVVVVTYDPVDLRAGRRLSLPLLFVCIPDSLAGGTLKVEWSLASTARDVAAASGDLQIGVAPAVVLPELIQRDLLRA
jgi:hypothetical protein